MNFRSLYQCLLIVKGTPEMAPLREWIDEEIKAGDKRLRMLQGDNFRTEQGRVQKLDELKQMIEQSDVLLAQEVAKTSHK